MPDQHLGTPSHITHALAEKQHSGYIPEKQMPCERDLPEPIASKPPVAALEASTVYDKGGPAQDLAANPPKMSYASAARGMSEAEQFARPRTPFAPSPKETHQRALVGSPSAQPHASASESCQLMDAVIPALADSKLQEAMTGGDSGTVIHRPDQMRRNPLPLHWAEPLNASSEVVPQQAVTIVPSRGEQGQGQICALSKPGSNGKETKSNSRDVPDADSAGTLDTQKYHEQGSSHQQVGS